MTDNLSRPRFNLYYIFEADKAANPMPPSAAEKIKKEIFQIFSKNIKPIENPIPPY